MIKNKAFTLVELVVVVAIIGVLATIVSPVIGNAIEKAKIAKVVVMVKILEDACDRYYADTGVYAIEYSGYAQASYHGLSVNDGTSNWAGPYIKSSISCSDNPLGSGCAYLYQGISTWSAPGNYDLNGDGTDDRTGSGNTLCLNSVPENLAYKVNSMYDAGVAGAWNVTGKVKYVVKSASGDYTTNSLAIYITGGS